MLDRTSARPSQLAGSADREKCSRGQASRNSSITTRIRRVEGTQPQEQLTATESCSDIVDVSCIQPICTHKALMQHILSYLS